MWKKAGSSRPQQLERAERTEEYVIRAKRRECRWRIFGMAQGMFFQHFAGSLAGGGLIYAQS